jgi:hypothetical protein
MFNVSKLRRHSLGGTNERKRLINLVINLNRVFLEYKSAILPCELIFSVTSNYIIITHPTLWQKSPKVEHL